MENFTETKHISLARIRDEVRLRYNPLNNLTPQKITSAMDDFRAGHLSRAAKIYDAIRRRDGIVQACVQKRKRATSRLGWTIVEMGEDEKASAKQAEFLEDFYNNIKITSAADANKVGSMSMLIENILSALENQYAVSEIIWDTSNAPKLRAEIRSVPLWFFENTQGILRFKKSSYDTEGIELKKNGWLVSVNDSPLMEATAVCYIIKRFAMGDWSAFSERFGSATPVLNSTAARGSTEWEESVNTLSHLANGMGIVIGRDEVFDLKQANGTGAPFKDLVDEMNRMIALIWRGSDLSTLSASNNTGASLQADEAEILEDSDCALVEETLAHYLTLPALQWRFGTNATPAAYLQLTRKNRADKLKQLDVFKRSTELGCPPSKRDVYEAMEIREPESDEEKAEILQQSIETFANSENATKTTIDELAEAKRKDIEPLLKEFEALEKITDAEEYATALSNLEKKMLELPPEGKNEAEKIFALLERELKK